MKAFFILIFFSLMLATYQQVCIGSLFLPEIIDGKEVWPSACTDFHDNIKHLIGSTWESHDGSSCECRRDGLHCCRTPKVPIALPANV
ncbi:small serum protein 4-like [Thamnophis elegans]|uniref:small serum protein 4-like n=1 Tax=Thamnophis elegans TaxID=35005 RepID=UPI0013771776|nr:small serum protein 4-like [Thamnophis elegans]